MIPAINFSFVEVNKNRVNSHKYTVVVVVVVLRTKQQYFILPTFAFILTTS